MNIKVLGEGCEKCSQLYENATVLSGFVIA